MSNTNNMSGTLYVVATPIGNLQDITLRAIDVLKEVDRIAAEDTRHAGRLLNHFSIKKPSFSLHGCNEGEKINKVLALLQQGENIALVSDAGTPLISDPGYLLVSAVKAAGFRVIPVPGPCAAIAALSACGLPTDRFVFEGFLSSKAQVRDERLLSLKSEKRTLIFYEAPHRLLSTLAAMQKVFGEQRVAVVARELTKVHESIIIDRLDVLSEYYVSHPEAVRGEVVIIVRGNAEDTTKEKELPAEKVLAVLLKELPLKQAVKLASQLTGVRKNALYELALLARE